MSRRVPSNPSASPAEVFHEALPGIQAGNVADLIGRCTDDVVFEFPFAPAGRPRRVAGREAVLGYLEPIFGRVRLERLIGLEVHQTLDPQVAVIELTASARISGDPAVRELSYVVVLTVREGLIARYRDYWNALALTSGAREAVDA